MHLSTLTTDGRQSRAVVDLFRKIPTTSFEDEWETPRLLEDNAVINPAWMLTSLDDEQVIAAAIGGRTLGIGCFCHLGVRSDRRRQRIGQRMVEHTIETEGLRLERAYAITTARNNDADRFWLERGFAHEPAPHYEFDLPESLWRSVPTPRLQSALDVTGHAHGLIEARCRTERKYVGVMESLRSGTASAFAAGVNQSRRTDCVVLAGTFGVRGTLEILSLHDRPPENVLDLLQQGLRWIGAQGVRRVHAFPKEEQVPALMRVGFAAMVNEKTFVWRSSS